MATVIMDQRPVAGGKAPRSRKTRGTTSPTTGAGPSKRSVSGRNRVSFTSDQLDDMEHVFQVTQYPDVTILEALAIRLQLPIEKICTWFQNRRSKWRKESKKGHITWMREQLLSGGQKEPNPEEAINTAKKSPQSNAHVLSKVNTQLSPDDKIPKTRVHHLPTPQTPVTTYSQTSSYPGQMASYPCTQQRQPQITSTQVQQQMSAVPHQSPVMLNSGAYMGGQSHWTPYQHNSGPYTINNTALYTPSWNTMNPASSTYTGWYGQTGHIPNYHMTPYVNSSRVHPYHIRDNNSQYTCTSPQISSNNHNESGSTTINSPPSCAASQFSTLNSSPVSNHSASSLNGAKNLSASPATNNSNLSYSSTGTSLSPACEHNPQKHSDIQTNTSQEKTTYHTVASFTPITMPTAEYPIPSLTPFSLSQCYDTLDDYTPAVYSVL